MGVCGLEARSLPRARSQGAERAEDPVEYISSQKADPDANRVGNTLHSVAILPCEVLSDAYRERAYATDDLLAVHIAELKIR